MQVLVFYIRSRSQRKLPEYFTGSWNVYQSDPHSRIFPHSIQPINSMLLGKSLCSCQLFGAGKLCSLRACHSHSADSVEEKFVSESGPAVLSNVWSLRRSVRRANLVSFFFLFFYSLNQLIYRWKTAHKISCTHISEKARAQIFAWVFGDRDIIYSLQHKQPFLMFIINHSCDCFRPYIKRNRATSMR